MLKELDYDVKISKQDYQEAIKPLQAKLMELQRQLKELEIPVMIAFEGFGAAGKGVQTAQLLKGLDPRGFIVYPVKNETEEEAMHPFLWRFWNKMPAKGRISIFDSSWYRRVLIDYFEKRVDKKQVKASYKSIATFESQLAAEGMLIIKVFLAIDEKTQKKRFSRLLADENTAWRVTAGDLLRNKKFSKYAKINEAMLKATSNHEVPWHVIPAKNRRYTTLMVYEAVIEAMESAISKKQEAREVTVYHGEPEAETFHETVLDKVDLSLSLTKEEYQKKREKLQDKLESLHGELYRRRIPVVIGFEGWDAGGKGGAIKRLAAKLDPRGYQVNPTASPNEWERRFPYLWRFWQNVPKYGHIGIFDRTWYGRVMVERIEGFCTKPEWQRAYKEINDMERDWTNEGYVVLKFWMHIDKDEQKRRFDERSNNPLKKWKITDEDWRNREKWDAYEEAVNEMIIRTDKPAAPWIIVPGNCKYYARIKVLETVVAAIEARLQEG